MHIFHTSIPVREPKRVAEALTKLFNGAMFDFLHPGCYFVLLGEPGALIELYRKELELQPGDQGEECRFVETPLRSPYTGAHTAVRVSASTERVFEIAKEYGWKAEMHRRKVFRVIEFWIENEYLLEVFPPDLAREYLATYAFLISGGFGRSAMDEHPEGT